MSDPSHPVRRIGTRAAVRQEASNMTESEAAPPAEPALPATPDTSSPNTDTSSTDTPNTDTPEDSPNVEPKVELKQEPMDTSPSPAPAVTTEPTLVAVQTPPLISTTLQIRDNVLLQPLGPSPFAGRKRKANFSNEETETLVRDVVEHFSALYGSEALRTESTRRNLRRSQLWTQIQKNVNELGYTPRSIDDLKHKWRDLRLEVKRKITQRKTGTKVSPAPGLPPIIDTKLTPLEDLVASTIGHHCTLDGEQEGMYMEPGVPRQSIFFTCRGPGGAIGEIGNDRMGSGASPRPTPEISVMSPLVTTSPAQLSFVHVTNDTQNGERDVTQNVPKMKWPTMKELCTLVATSNLIPPTQTIITAPSQILNVKQEVVPAQPVLAPARCESQNSVASSPEGSVGNPAGRSECNTGGSNDGGNNNNPTTTSSSPDTSVVKTDVETLQLKVENDGTSQDGEKASPMEDEDRGNWQENPEEWERQSQSPQSENAADDSMPSSSSQDGDPSSVGEIPTNGDCTFEPDDHKYRNMNRLLELEEQWDRLYHRELGIWEEERIQQQQQRNQDRELQQQLLSVLTDIRDELRQIRQERAEARQNQADASTNGSASVTNTSPTVAISPKPSTESPAETPTKSTPARRRGRPRLIRPAPEPVRPIRPASESSKS
ncbi:uncharacterized protein [Dendropsophus ebraccatus]|uniref:uncharacterized protein n=1 Tax=Dendropsophus ebraccatus TaxID=150705 RepID=UPI0038310239